MNYSTSLEICELPTWKFVSCKPEHLWPTNLEICDLPTWIFVSYLPGNLCHTNLGNLWAINPSICEQPTWKFVSYPPGNLGATYLPGNLCHTNLGNLWAINLSICQLPTWKFVSSASPRIRRRLASFMYFCLRLVSILFLVSLTFFTSECASPDWERICSYLASSSWGEEKDKRCAFFLVFCYR